MNFNININEYLNSIANLEVITLKYPNFLNSQLERHGYLHIPIEELQAKLKGMSLINLEIIPIQF